MSDDKDKDVMIGPGADDYRDAALIYSGEHPNDDSFKSHVEAEDWPAVNIFLLRARVMADLERNQILHQINTEIRVIRRMAQEGCDELAKVGEMIEDMQAHQSALLTATEPDPEDPATR